MALELVFCQSFVFTCVLAMDQSRGHEHSRHVRRRRYPWVVLLDGDLIVAKQPAFSDKLIDTFLKEMNA
jgi:hypothetical protein